MSKDHAIPDQLCPSCGHHLQAATNFTDGAAPKEGDVVLCIRCNHAAIFDAALKLRAASARDFRLMSSTERDELRKMRSAVRRLPRVPLPMHRV